MLVTDKKYYMDNFEIQKLDLMIKRMEKTDDNILPIDGDEGQGKTEKACGVCYYVSYKTRRSYTIDNIFFNLDDAIKFAANTQEQIIHIDEGAFGLLTTQWYEKSQKKFLQLVMTARKKKHFIVICIPKFYKLNQYIIEERTIGLIHVYSRKNLQKGMFCYYTKAAKDKLYEDWRRKKTKTYKKNYTFRGRFVKVMGKIFSPEQLELYEEKKDKAIAELTKERIPEITKERKMRNALIIERYKEGKSHSEQSKFFVEKGYPITPQQIGRIVQETHKRTPNTEHLSI